MNPTGSPSTTRQRALRLQAIQKLGGCCRVCGFPDARALEIDHVVGGGTAERLRGVGGLKHLYLVLKDETGKFQLLCANCHAIKRSESGEARGWHQHRSNRLEANAGPDRP